MGNYDIIIVGAGPSGTSAALEITNLNPFVANRILLLDRATFPRSKLCAGGVTKEAESILQRLGVSHKLQSIPIHTSEFILPGGSLICRQTNQFQILRRLDFDYFLLRTARERGIVVRDGEAVEGIRRASDAVVIRTSKNEYRAKILIGADGANGIVQKLLKIQTRCRMMGLEILVPSNDGTSMPIPNSAIFDFSASSYRLPLYFWIFPSISVKPTFSIGLMRSPFGNGELGSLKEVFDRWLIKRGLNLESYDLQAHPSACYAPRARYSRSRVLLVGDAAGTDPLFGEGITSALATGRIAAQCAFEAIRKNDFSFSDYEERVRSCEIGVLMRRRYVVARRLYAKGTQYNRGQSYESVLNWVAPADLTDDGASISWEPSGTLGQSNLICE